MFSPEEIEKRLDRILLRVQKPGRYVGGEYNQTVKDWASVDMHVALVFPDIYDIGISNLGIQILYDLINARPDALVERAYAPWIDMEEQMRQSRIPLYSLESRHALADFDLVGFSLPYETLYTNVLNLLDLAGIPVQSANRDERHPLVIAGGHACFNPEPMHAFIDVFVIGEGEQVIGEIMDACRQARADKLSRSETLKRLAQIQGIYVPSLYEVKYNDAGTISNLTPADTEVPRTVLKRMIPKLPPAPTRFLVPNIEAIHNRVSVEVMRGCTHGCRFCQAGMIMRPARERPIEEVVQAARDAVAATGAEELALLSLSSSDYSGILDLVEKISQAFADKHLTVSLPSLRIESTSVALMESLKGRRSGGFTLAPEAATERMRSIINKYITDDQILETAGQIYQRGWTNIKLYFMIGHPSETLEDVQAIVALCKRVLEQGRRVLGGRAKLHAGVSTFIPKPHTPFQWAVMDSMDQIRAKQELLMRELRGSAYKLSWTPPEDTLLEGWLSRGDRRMSEVIYSAWKNGTKFDAWQDQRQIDAWMNAFSSVGLDPAFYTHRPRLPDEILPWDHISSGLRKKYLYAEFERSQRGEMREDCREACDACGILPTFNGVRYENPGFYWKCPEVKRAPVKRQGVEQG